MIGVIWACKMQRAIRDHVHNILLGSYGTATYSVKAHDPTSSPERGRSATICPLRVERGRGRKHFLYLRYTVSYCVTARESRFIGVPGASPPEGSTDSSSFKLQGPRNFLAVALSVFRASRVNLPTQPPFELARCIGGTGGLPSESSGGTVELPTLES